MGKGLFVAFNIAFIVGYALLANALGVASETVEIPTTFVAPEGGSFLDKIIAPFVWAMDAAGAFFQMMGLAFVGVNIYVFTFIFGPLFMLDMFIIYGMVRGGGT